MYIYMYIYIYIYVCIGALIFHTDKNRDLEYFPTRRKTITKRKCSLIKSYSRVKTTESVK